MKLGCRSGHNEKCRGAKGILDEVVEDKKIFTSCVKYLKTQNAVVDCTPYHNPLKQLEDLKYGVDKANSNKVDFFFSIHLNKCYDEVQNHPMGCEVWVYDKNSTLAMEKAKGVLENLQALGFKSRGIKYMSTEGKSLYELNETKMNAMIVECFFLESKVDCQLYTKLGYDKVGQAIANGIDSRVNFSADNTPEYAIDTVVIVSNSTDELAAKYLNRAFGWGILMPHQYALGTARRVIGVGGGACKEVKCDIEIIGLDSYDTCRKVMEYIIENRK